VTECLAANSIGAVVERSDMIDKRIIGTWRLKKTKGVDDAGKVLPPPYGPAPNGLVCFQADGRMYCVLCDGRAELPAGEPRQFMSYAGNYTFDGTLLSTRVDASSDAGRIGGDQLRNVRFENGGMVLAPPRRLYAGVMQHQELLWERVA
jgi:lipocalin-like protein